MALAVQCHTAVCFGFIRYDGTPKWPARGTRPGPVARWQSQRRSARRFDRAAGPIPHL